MTSLPSTAAATTAATTATTAATTDDPRPLRPWKALPGPRLWPIVGNALQVDIKRFHLSLERFARDHGPLVRLKFGPYRGLLVADHQLVAGVLRERPKTFRRPKITADLLRELGGQTGLFLAEGSQWRDQRRMVMQGFTAPAIKAYFPSLREVAQRLEQRWRAAASAGRPVDLDADLKRYTVDIIAGLTFGTDVNTIDHGDDAIQGHMDTILLGLARRSFALFPHWRYLRLPADRKLERSLVALRDAVAGFIGAARTRLDAQPALRSAPTNLLEAMIAAADLPDSGVDQDAIVGNVSALLIGGEETTAHSLGWLIWLLGQHPEALQRARAEVRQLAPATAQFSVEQMDGLVYLDACIQESMRLRPVAPYVPLEALHDTVVGDVQVSAGTYVYCIFRPDNLSDAHFADASRFHPERWLASDNHAAPDKRVAMPFGAGPRTCPGRYLALLEMKVAMAMLLGQFDIVRVATPDGKQPQEQVGFTMSPGPLRMQLAL